MMASERFGKVQTVCGLVAASEFKGVTLTHEHLSINAVKGLYVPPKNADLPAVPWAWSMENLGYVRHNPFSVKDNLQIGDRTEDIIPEIAEYVAVGGKNLVESTTRGLARNVPLYLDVSRKTGVNIVAGGGYYVTEAQDPGTLALSEEQLYATMLLEVTEGVDNTDVICGMLGELGSQWPISDFERRVLRAAAAVQASTGCPVQIHPGRHPSAPLEICRILQEAGADLSKVNMSHLDRTFSTREQVNELADGASGCYLEWDLFGLEVAYYQQVPSFLMPNDGTRIRTVRDAILDDHVERVLLSQDVHTKHRLKKFGGHGYGHILTNVVPMMLFQNITQEQIDIMLQENPTRWLTYEK